MLTSQKDGTLVTYHLLQTDKNNRPSLLELPLLPAHGAEVLGLLRVEPLHDAVDVEAVGALNRAMLDEIIGTFLFLQLHYLLIVKNIEFHLTPVSSLSPDEGAVVPGQLAVGAAAVEGDAADAAGVVVGHPFPRSNSIPALDRHLKKMSKFAICKRNHCAGSSWGPL